MDASSLITSERSLTFATAAAFKDVDAIKTSVATSTMAATYTGAALNGALGDDQFGSYPYGRRLSVTLSDAAGAYNDEDAIEIDAIVLVADGLIFRAEEQTLTATPSTADGDETLLFDDVCVVQVLEIRAPAQDDTDGAFEFGVADIIAPPHVGFTVGREIKALGDGTIHVEYRDGSEDTIAVHQNGVEVKAPTRIFGDVGTDVGFVIAL